VENIIVNKDFANILIYIKPNRRKEIQVPCVYLHITYILVTHIKKTCMFGTERKEQASRG